MLQFNLHLYALPDQQLEPKAQVLIGSSPIQTWQVHNIDRHLMPVSFEQIEHALSSLPRMFFELDGSFVWRGGQPNPTINSSSPTADWQIDGMVYDVAGQVARVELKGCCPPYIFTQLLTCIQPLDRLLAYSLDHGCFFRVCDFVPAQ